MNDKPFTEIRHLLLGYGLTAGRLSEAIGSSPSTAQRRLNDPGSLTLRELMGACRRGGIPAERIREAIRFDY